MACPRARIARIDGLRFAQPILQSCFFSASSRSRRRPPGARAAGARQIELFLRRRQDRPSVDGSPVVGQMYVEYMIPQRSGIPIRS